MNQRWFRLRLPVVIVVAVAAFWGSGFVWFINVTRRPAEPPPRADGIVALTGGAGRVELALHLLASGRADKLLLSGIGGGTDLATLGRLAGIDTTGLADRITLGRYAASTRGNGVETAAWAEQNRIRSLIVVTAAYHMPRALAELHRALPAIHLFPLPVFPPPALPPPVFPPPVYAVAGHPGTAERGLGLRLEAEEYTKYLLTVSGLSAWLPHREAVPVFGLPAGAGE